MSFKVPNTSGATHADQARLFETDLDALVAGQAVTGVFRGGVVTAQGSPNMTTAVSTGLVGFTGRRVILTGGNVTHATAHATNPRIDLVVAQRPAITVHSVVATVITGTAATPPEVPAVTTPANTVVLAAVYVPANDTTLSSGQIISKRVVIPFPEGDEGLVNPKYWGAVGDGTTDETTFLQGCLDYIDTANKGHIMQVGSGKHRITANLVWNANTAIVGTFGSTGGQATRPPEIVWDGPTTASAGDYTTSCMLRLPTSDASATEWKDDTTLPVSGGTRTWQYIKNMIFRNPSLETVKPQWGIVFGRRVDTNTRIEDCQFIGMSVGALRFESGGLNVSLSNCRFDGIGHATAATTAYAIWWKLGSGRQDSIYIQNITTDNRNNDNNNAMGGVLYCEGFPGELTGGDRTEMWISVRNAKIEVNNPMPAGDASFKFKIDPTYANRHMFHVHFDTVWIYQEGGSNGVNLLVSPSYELQDFVMINCKGFSGQSALGVVGQSYITGSRSAGDVPLQVFSPHERIPTNVTPNSAITPAAEFWGGFNLGGRMFNFGKQVALLIWSATGAAAHAGTVAGLSGDTTPYGNGRTYEIGECLVDPSIIAAASSTAMPLKIVSVPGTEGTLTGVTLAAAYVSGNSFQPNTLNGLGIGMFVAIAGATGGGKRITNINGLASPPTVTVSSGWSSGASSGAAVSYNPPTYITINGLVKA